MFGPETMPIMTADDRFLINMPMFHVGGATLLFAMLIHGGSVALVDGFSAERFWAQIRDTGQHDGLPARRHGQLRRAPPTARRTTPTIR